MKPARGRPRNPALDEVILAVARRQLANIGYEGMSLTSVAEEAGTTRQALYRRWPGKADLATAAIASLSRADERKPTADVFGDLVRELAAFRDGVTRPDGLAMVGLMLLGSTDPELVRLYRERIVAPRRARFSEILLRARALKLIVADGDIELATTILTGSWYAGALAGVKPPDDWPERVARLAWRSLGGSPPD